MAKLSAREETQLLVEALDKKLRRPTTLTKHQLDLMGVDLNLSSKSGIDLNEDYRFMRTGKGKLLIRQDDLVVEIERVANSLVFKDKVVSTPPAKVSRAATSGEMAEISAAEKTLEAINAGLAPGSALAGGAADVKRHLAAQKRNAAKKSKASSGSGGSTPTAAKAKRKAVNFVAIQELLESKDFSNFNAQKYLINALGAEFSIGGNLFDPEKSWTLKKSGDKVFVVQGTNEFLVTHNGGGKFTYVPPVYGPAEPTIKQRRQNLIQKETRKRDSKKQQKQGNFSTWDSSNVIQPKVTVTQESDDAKFQKIRQQILTKFRAAAPRANSLPIDSFISQVKNFRDPSLLYNFALEQFSLRAEAYKMRADAEASSFDNPLSNAVERIAAIMSMGEAADNKQSVKEALKRLATFGKILEENFGSGDFDSDQIGYITVHYAATQAVLQQHLYILTSVRSVVGSLGSKIKSGIGSFLISATGGDPIVSSIVGFAGKLADKYSEQKERDKRFGNSDREFVRDQRKSGRERRIAEFLKLDATLQSGSLSDVRRAFGAKNATLEELLSKIGGNGFAANVQNVPGSATSAPMSNVFGSTPGADAKTTQLQMKLLNKIAENTGSTSVELGRLAKNSDEAEVRQATQDLNTLENQRDEQQSRSLSGDQSSQKSGGQGLIAKLTSKMFGSKLDIGVSAQAAQETSSFLGSIGSILGQGFSTATGLKIFSMMGRGVVALGVGIGGTLLALAQIAGIAALAIGGVIVAYNALKDAFSTETSDEYGLPDSKILRFLTSIADAGGIGTKLLGKDYRRTVAATTAILVPGSGFFTGANDLLHDRATSDKIIGQKRITREAEKFNAAKEEYRNYDKMIAQQPGESNYDYANRVRNTAPKSEIEKRVLDAHRSWMNAKKDLADKTTFGGNPAPFKPTSAMTGKYDEKIVKTAQEFNLDPNLMRAMVEAESGGNPNARSPVGARGLMQLMPGTARDMGVDPDDPDQNLKGGMKYFAIQLKRYGDVKKALAAYNAGPKNVDDYNGVPPFTETRAYVSKIMRRSGELQRLEQSRKELAVVEQKAKSPTMFAPQIVNNTSKSGSPGGGAGANSLTTRNSEDTFARIQENQYRLTPLGSMS